MILSIPCIFIGYDSHENVAYHTLRLIVKASLEEIFTAYHILFNQRNSLSVAFSHPISLITRDRACLWIAT